MAAGLDAGCKPGMSTAALSAQIIYQIPIIIIINENNFVGLQKGKEIGNEKDKLK